MDPILIIILAVVALTIVVVAVMVTRHRPDEPTAPPTLPAHPTTGKGLRERLARPRGALAGALGSLLSSSHLDDTDWEELEDTLVAADVGPKTSSEIVASVRSAKPESGEEARSLLERELVSILAGRDRGLRLEGSPAVIVVVGVNGTGKTTSIAKIANELVNGGSSVVLGAADTFRAAADTQLRTWGDRVGVPVVSGTPGADPASVAFEALSKAKNDGTDVVIVDTAGRLHSQTNLMDELRKVVRILEREAGAIDEILLVLDGTTGQNGLAQASAFVDAVGITGLVLTKLDGTSRGGIAIAVERTLGVPVKYIGVGEGMDDLLPFEPEAFVEALIAR